MHSKTSPNGHNGLRARPARVTSHHKNKQHDIHNGLRRQVNRSRRLRTYFFIFFSFFFFVETERSPTAAAAANRILFPGIYISGGEWTRIAVFVGEEQGARAGVKGRCQTRHKRSAELDAIAARDKMYVGEVTKELGVLLYLLVSRD